MSDPNPAYPELPRAAKWRRLANSRDLTPDERRAYGDAVLEGIRTLRRQEFARAGQSHRWNCASGTAHNTGEEILAAIGRQNRAALERAAQADRQPAAAPPAQPVLVFLTINARSDRTTLAKAFRFLRAA